MNAEKLKKLIMSLIDDIEFDHNGIHGAICPINKDTFYLSYGDNAVEASSIDEVMNIPFIGGNSLNDVSKSLEFDHDY